MANYPPDNLGNIDFCHKYTYAKKAARLEDEEPQAWPNHNFDRREVAAWLRVKSWDLTK